MRARRSPWPALLAGAALLGGACSLRSLDDLSENLGAPSSSRAGSSPGEGSAGAATTGRTGGGDGGVSAGGNPSAGAAGGGGTSGTLTDQPLGSACADDGECASGHCADGLCCNAPCDGVCQTCRGSEQLPGLGVDGDCGLVRSGIDPRADCPVSDECGSRGVCDGGGACALWEAGHVCGPSSCADGVKRLPPTCDGDGTCLPGSTETCAPMVCDGTVCQGQCTGDDDCTGDDFCDALGACQLPKTTGQTCSRDAECETGHCTDDVCCDAACDGDCESCVAAKSGGTDGVCTAAPAGVDPDGDCGASSPTSCGLSGVCSGSRSCAFHDEDTACASASCSDATVTATRRCDGAGSCGTGKTMSCGAYQCDGAASCLMSCGGNDDCTSTNLCILGECGPKRAIGEPCEQDGDCASDFCAADDDCAPRLTLIGATVSGMSASGGGGNTIYWKTTNASGSQTTRISSDFSSNLYALPASGWEADFTTVVPPRTYFTIHGGEGSNPITRSFTFRTSASTAIDRTISIPGGSGDAVHQGSASSSSSFLRFYWNGETLTHTFISGY